MLCFFFLLPRRTPPPPFLLRLCAANRDRARTWSWGGDERGRGARQAGGRGGGEVPARNTREKNKEKRDTQTAVPPSVDLTCCSFFSFSFPPSNWMRQPQRDGFERALGGGCQVSVCVSPAYQAQNNLHSYRGARQWGGVTVVKEEVRATVAERHAAWAPRGGAAQMRRLDEWKAVDRRASLPTMKHTALEEKTKTCTAERVPLLCAAGKTPPTVPADKQSVARKRGKRRHARRRSTQRETMNRKGETLDRSKPRTPGKRDVRGTGNRAREESVCEGEKKEREQRETTKKAKEKQKKKRVRRVQKEGHNLFCAGNFSYTRTRSHTYIYICMSSHPSVYSTSQRPMPDCCLRQHDPQEEKGMTKSVLGT